MNMDTKVNLDDLKVGYTIKLANGTVAVVTKIDPYPSDDRLFQLQGYRYTVHFPTADGTPTYWNYRKDGTGPSLYGEQIVEILRPDQLSYEEVIEELVIEADALEKDLEEAHVMIEALDTELDELVIKVAKWERLAKTLHKAYLEQVEINKAKQDELDFQSEQLEEFMLGDFDDEVTIEFVSLDDLVDTEDELYDPFLADRYS